MKKTLKILFLISVSMMFVQTSFAQLNQAVPADVEGVGVEEKLGSTIPWDLTFATSEGDSVTIKELMSSGKPVLLNPLYYDCPSLCGLVIESVYKVVNQLSWNPGEDYTIISYSIDPTETPEQAAEEKHEIMASFNRPGAEDGWHFLTGNEKAIAELSEAIGFSYKYDEETGEYLHLASIMLISPDAVVTRYLYGINFLEFDLRNALYEAADGKIGSTIERAVLYCFTYDSESQNYVPVAINIMKLGGLATMLILGIFLMILWRRERGSSTSQNIEFENE
ncbi:MAG: SCO family protein [Balneolaceae bacterium]